ncbi:WD domain, G-beta repeat-containing protein, putative [Eimeria mitis]|uniref:WD domain, G-beta repeat-containing protein, putative n=1 Tax=Eimeria mitis TaxID=44415 RepID=U6JSI8_9EIME|nr:WD domain, G-beta repeat-containing protein, putative [Eimeria mitis]CDJ28369.1 WD domain, G-beta repeat-containing protein, putative [Eimeria mitis]
MPSSLQVLLRRYLLSSSRDGSIALYDLEADAAFNLNGGFGPEPKVHPIGYVQRKPDRPPKRNLLPLHFQPAAERLVLRGQRLLNESGSTSASREKFAGSNGAQAGHSRSVTSVEFMPGDNGLFVSTGLDKLLKIWDTRAWECVLDIAVESPILCCAFDRVGFHSKTAFGSRARSSMGSIEHSVDSQANLTLATGCQDGSVRIFDMRCGVAQQTFVGHKGAVLSLTWDPVTPSQLFSGSSDKSIRRWDIRRNDACLGVFDKGKPDLDFFLSSVVTSDSRRTKVPDRQILTHAKKRTRNSFDGMVNRGHEAKRTRSEGQTKQQHPLSSSEPARLRDSLRDHPSDPLASEHHESMDVIRGAVGVRGTIISASMLERGSGSSRGVSSLSNIGDMECDASPSSRGGSQKHILQMGSGGRTKRRLHVPTVSSPLCRLAGSESCIRANSESVSFPAKVPTSQGLNEEMPPQNRLNRREERGKTCSAVCDPLTSEGESYAGGNGALGSASEARHAVGKLFDHSDPVCFEGNRHGLSSVTGISCRDGNSTTEAVASGQLFCGSGRPRKNATALRSGDTWGVFGEPECRCTGSKLFLRGDGYSGSTVQERSVFSDVSAHEGAVTCLVPSPDGAYLVSSGSDGRIRLWNALTGSHCFVHMILNVPSESSVRASAREPRGGRIVGTPAKPEKPKTTTNMYGSIWGVQAAMSRSGEYLIHGRGRVLCTFDIMTGAELQITAPDHRDDIVCVIWNDEKSEAYAGAVDGSVLIYDATCGYGSDDSEEEDDSEEVVPVVDVTPVEPL